MNTPNYIDIHSQLQFSQFDADRDAVIARMRETDVWTITVGTSPAMSEEAVALAEQHDGFFATVGTHPTDWQAGFDTKLFKRLVENKKVVAVGECGLDYFRDASTETKREQKKLFEQHIELACKQNLPLMLHCRPSKGTMDAYHDALDMLESCGRSVRANAHFFVGDIPVAKRFLALGMTMSFDGPITFTHDYDEVIQYLPQDMLHAETDAPFAAPAPYRGKRSEPVHVIEIVQALARIRGENDEQLRLQLIQNAQKTFGLALA